MLIRFAEPDSEDNIMFDQKELRNTNIKGGTLLKLVERLTFHKYASEYASKSNKLKPNLMRMFNIGLLLAVVIYSLPVNGP